MTELDTATLAALRQRHTTPTLVHCGSCNLPMLATGMTGLQSIPCTRKWVCRDPFCSGAPVWMYDPDPTVLVLLDAYEALVARIKAITVRSTKDDRVWLGGSGVTLGSIAGRNAVVGDATTLAALVAEVEHLQAGVTP